MTLCIHNNTREHFGNVNEDFISDALVAHNKGLTTHADRFIVHSATIQYYSLLLVFMYLYVKYSKI